MTQPPQVPRQRFAPAIGRRRHGIVEPAIVAAMAIAVGLLPICSPVNPFDEALILVGAERVLHGEIPFRDFYAIYPPGQYWVVGGLIGLFGDSPLTVRLYCIAVRALIAALLFVIVRHVAPRRLAWAAATACVLWTSFGGVYGYPLFPALGLVLLVLILLARSVELREADGTPWRGALPIAGAILGVAALFRHDVAGYGFAASVPFLVALSRELDRPKSRASPARSSAALRVWGKFLAGSAAAFGIPMAMLLALVPVREVMSELFTYPFMTYAKVRGLPYPPLVPFTLTGEVLTRPGALFEWLSYLPAYTPLVIFGAGVLWAIARLRAEEWGVLRNVRTLRVLSLLILGILTFNLARVRADMIHGLAMLMLSYGVAAAMLASAWNSRGAWRLPATAAFLAVGGISLSTPLYQLYASVRDHARALGGSAAMECRSCGAEREAAAAYVRSMVPPGGRIYVGCGRHDIVFVNEPILYHLAQRLPGVKYHALDPGVANTLEAQRDIIAGLERHRVEYLILSTAFDEIREPNLSAVSTGVTALDDYIHAHYRVDRAFGAHHTVWKRAG